jgi:hypothetical protein
VTCWQKNVDATVDITFWGFPLSMDKLHEHFGVMVPMGYDLYITRANEHFMPDGQEITAGEWLEIVKSDPTLRLEGQAFPYLALWSGDDICGKSVYPDAWLDWAHGNIYSKSPDKPIIRKMILLAEKLGAKVQGDDLELYTWDELKDQE